MSFFNKATKHDYEEIMTFLEQERLLNFFFIGDIETYGIDSPFMPILLHKNEKELIDSIALVYYSTLLIYDPYKLVSTNELKDLIEKYKIKTININESVYKHFESFFNDDTNRFKIHKQTLAACDKTIYMDSNDAIKASYIHIPMIVQSRMHIDEFKDLVSNYDQELNIYQESYKKGVFNSFIVQKDNKVVAHAGSLIETKYVSVIGGVFCLADYRKRGYASQCVYKLTNEIAKKGKKPVLFYNDDNHKASKIYQKIGYKNLGNLYTISIIN
ncbi:GNAT family N-acetyltransferase [Mycoplasma sp. U97]|uniref:GNAT family N-acetyltransferase n=1 Tax=Mycoplasma tauri TaxID=547987 RepID=UPI001CBB34A6|nr:GNAT family N-acetyltransferase [Mycoplasma tauri]MBZ4212639.1 GNAT family N-acetyltransferase [Mycoplasma tauri]